MSAEVHILERECAPAPLAEHIPFEVAIAGMRRFGTKRRPEGQFMSAWHHAEVALTRDRVIDNTVRRSYIDYAQDLLGEIVRNNKAHADTQLGALVLSSYMQCLQKRALGQEILPEDCKEIYRSLGAAISYLQPLAINKPPQWRMTETLVLAASSRIQRPDMLMYPSSPREESSPVSERNHDGYFLRDKSKLAIQQKLIATDKTYDESITVLVLEPILRRAYVKAGLNTKELTVAEQLNYVLSLIVSETSGRNLTSSEQQILNHLSSAVAHHKFAAEKQVHLLNVA